VEIEHYTRTLCRNQQILLPGLTRAFGASNRTILRAVLYKQGLPIQNIPQLRRGREETLLQVKHNKQYGDKILNNIGVFQGASAGRDYSSSTWATWRRTTRNPATTGAYLTGQRRKEHHNKKQNSTNRPKNSEKRTIDLRNPTSRTASEILAKK